MNLSAFPGLAGECFGSFISETRSSQSVSAVLKDFILGPFAQCKATITTTPSTTAFALDGTGTQTVTYTAVVDAVGTVTLTGKVRFFFCTPAQLTGGVCSSGGTQVSLKDLTQTTPGHASATSDASPFITTTGTYCWRRVYEPAAGSPYSSVSDSATTECFIVVEAKISIGPSATNGIFENHTFPITVQQDPGTGTFGPAPNGTKPTVTLTNDATSNYINVTDNCASAGTTSGSCTVTFTSSTPGTVTGHATVTFSVGGVSVTRATDNTHGSTGDATKVFVAGSLAWFKDDNAGNPLAGATFQACRTLDRSGNPVSGECMTGILDNSSPDTNPVAGQFKIEGLRLGTWEVTETAAPPGFAPDPTTRSAVLTLTDPNATISIHFVNQRPIVKITGF